MHRRGRMGMTTPFPKDSKTTSPTQIFFFLSKWTTKSILVEGIPSLGRRLEIDDPKGPLQIKPSCDSETTLPCWTHQPYRSTQHQPSCKPSLWSIHGETESQNSFLCSWSSQDAEKSVPKCSRSSWHPRSSQYQVWANKCCRGEEMLTGA